MSVAPPGPEPIPEPAPLVKAGLPPALWTLIVVYLLQLAAAATVALIARLGLHVPADAIQAIAQIEVAGAVALAGTGIASGLHAIGRGLKPH